MANRQLFNHLQTRLARAGLPVGYIQRFTDELRDHFLDMEEERKNMSTDVLHEAAEERLGSVDELAATAIKEYRRRSFWGRHPIFTFVLAPIPLAIVFWHLYALIWWGLVIGAPWVFGSSFDMHHNLREMPERILWTEMTAIYLWPIIPPLLVAYLHCRLARRSSVGWQWPVISCALLAIVASLQTTDLKLPWEPGTGFHDYQLGYALNTLRQHILHGLPPLLVAAIWLRQRSKKRQSFAPATC